MTVTLSRQPKKRGPPGRRYIPDRPAGGYHVGLFEGIKSPLSEMDHVREIADAIATIEKLDTIMTKLETRIDRLIAKLTDPALRDDIPATDPRRIEAEDLRDELLETALRHLWTVEQAAGDIATHGGYLLDAGQREALDEIGRTLTHGAGVLGRIQADVAGVLTHRSWQRLTAAACAF